VPKESGDTNQILDLFLKDNEKIIKSHCRRRQARNKWSYLPENNFKYSEVQRKKEFEKKILFRASQAKKARLLEKLLK
jgi:hypothetical protein